MSQPTPLIGQIARPALKIPDVQRQGRPPLAMIDVGPSLRVKCVIRLALTTSAITCFCIYVEKEYKELAVVSYSMLCGWGIPSCDAPIDGPRAGLRPWRAGLKNLNKTISGVSA